MHLILNKDNLVLARGEEGWVKINEWKKVRMFTHYVTASQHAMKVGGDSKVFTCQDALKELIESFSFLGDAIHDCIVGNIDLRSTAEVGGLIEHKAMISSLTDINDEQRHDIKVLKREIDRMKIKEVEMEKVMKYWNDN